jgi:hypothetical protein
MQNPIFAAARRQLNCLASISWFFVRSVPAAVLEGFRSCGRQVTACKPLKARLVVAELDRLVRNEFGRRRHAIRQQAHDQFIGKSSENVINSFFRTAPFRRVLLELGAAKSVEAGRKNGIPT